MDEDKSLLLVGGGGHCKSILDCVLSAGIYKRISIIDNNRSLLPFGIPVIGTDDDLNHLRDEGWTDAFVSVGSIGSTVLRHKLFQKVKEIGFNVPTIIDPSARIARYSMIGEGSFVGKMAVVNTGAQIGVCSIVNTGSIVEHDSKVGAFSHISPGAILCGQVSVGNDTLIGAGTVIRQGIIIGDSTIIGAGSVVVKDIPSGVTAFGNPCKVKEL